IIGMRYPVGSRIVNVRPNATLCPAGSRPRQTMWNPHCYRRGDRPSDPVASLSELEVDALWRLYEGHSLVVERPGGKGSDASAHVVMSVAYDEAGEAVAEVVEVELSTFAALLERGYLERSDDGPVLDAHRWFDDHLG